MALHAPGTDQNVSQILSSLNLEDAFVIVPSLGSLGTQGEVVLSVPSYRTKTSSCFLAEDIQTKPFT